MFHLQKRCRSTGHFVFDCVSFRENVTILWSNLKTILFHVNSLESNFMFSVLENSDRMHKTMFLLGGLSLPFDSKTTTIVKRFVSTAVGKFTLLRTTVPLVSYIRNSLRFWYYASLNSTVVQILKKKLGSPGKFGRKQGSSF